MKVRTPAWLGAAIEAIDAANAQDPTLVDDAGVARPKELVHAEHMTAWLDRLDPDASPAQRLAARAHHFRRWTVPRSEFPDGRAGYLRWRKQARQRHAEEVSALLSDHGVPAEVIDEVGRIVAKAPRRSERGDSGLKLTASEPHSVDIDPPQADSLEAEVQTHEDCLCLTFFELQGLDTAARLGDKAAEVVAKTLEKMSAHGRSHLDRADLDPAVRELISSAQSTVEIIERLADADQRFTAQRRRIVSLLLGAGRPVSMPELLDADPDLAQSSVYRNLVVLEQAGVVLRVVTGSEFTRYELAEDLTGHHHHHLVCVVCGKVDDVTVPDALERQLEATLSALAEAHGFAIDDHRLDALGHCAACIATA